MKNIILARKGSALMISMFITVIILLIAIYLLDKIIPYSRDIKGIENGNIAYYRATTAVNEALLSMSSSNPGYETGATTMTNGSGYVLNVSAKGTKLPKAGEGTSEYNRDWNKIGLGNPVQLVLPSGIDWAASTITFRVPDLNKDGNNADQTLSGTTTPIINWILSGSGEVLIASGTQITATQINGATTQIKFNAASIKGGMTLSGTTMDFIPFYNSKCTTVQCTLKLSVINPLTLQVTGETVPYLEYQANFDVLVPLQFATINAEGYAGGFRQNITRYVQQLTTNEAMDFTVFQ
ncbi:MAG: hypothetical protein Q8K26_03375 [Candidatus Gracilibacteria bacterium]|nr:hypothetical protein [Candidatus Gracilibacteria bacterium]